MNIKKFLFLSLLAFVFFPYSSYGQKAKKHSIVIVADFSNNNRIVPDSNNRSLLIRDFTINFSNPPYETVNPTISGTVYTWKIETIKSKYIFNRLLFTPSCVLASNDSIYIQFNNGVPEYSGVGSIKCKSLYEVSSAQKKIRKPVASLQERGVVLITVNEFFQLNQYYDEQLATILPLIESYKSKLSSFDYTLMKFNFVHAVEKGRLDAFSAVPVQQVEVGYSERILKEYGVPCLSSKDKAALWDSAMFKSWGKWVRGQHNIFSLSSDYFYEFSREEVWRRFEWDILSNDTLASKPMRVKMYYDNLLKNYKGLRLEQTLAKELLDEEVTEELGAWNPVAQRLLKDYYSRSKFPEYKKWIQSLEASRQYFVSGNSGKNGGVPFFQVRDKDGKLFTEKNIKGKFAIINFWNSSCTQCKNNVAFLQNMQEKFKNDTNVVFLNVSTDADKKQWLKNKDAGIHSPKGGIQLYTEGLGMKHEMIKDLGITQCPMLRIVGSDGEMIINKVEPDLARNNGKWLEVMINTKKSYPEDGPYVMTENGDRKTYYIKNGKLSEASSMVQFASATDIIGKDLKFSLQQKIAIPPFEYAAPSKMLVLSDIEGNFSAFRKLLQSNGIIDENFNWIFDKDHLVFAGDMFDRGEQVTECLWLIYSLEEKARAAGGLVHFILGNHEIMNLNGQDGYVKEKYKKNYKLLGKTLRELYGEDSELGRWLRSKNIVEKIGDNLFCHGGISPQINFMDINLEEINTKARPYYDKSDAASKSSDEELKLLFNSRKSPFWYRHYYEKDYFSKSNNELITQATEAQLDSTLQKFGVSHIITGHTIVADTISVHFGGKIINTDVHHAGGNSEALLIENNRFYRVNAEGKRVLLFIDDKRKQQMQ